MIHAEFYREKAGGRLLGFCIAGHAGYADEGEDVVCASVSSAVQFACNLITECFHQKAQVNAVGGSINLLLGEGEKRREAVQVIDALKLHLELIGEEYPDTIQSIITEV